MPIPLIIIGAGASYDSIDRDRYLHGVYRETDLQQFQPPLISNLFDTNHFHEILKLYPAASSLAAEASYKSNFEEYLTHVEQVLAPKNEERFKQLIALRLYLSNLFSVITEKYHRSANNYGAIINKIYDNGGHAIFVNFNYDLLFERNIENIYITKNIDDYIRGRIKIIKIHGASNWFYQIEETSTNLSLGYVYFTQFAKNFYEYFRSEEAKKDIVIQNISHNGKFLIKNDRGSGAYYLPALAIPITTKGNYVCPDNHIQILKESLPYVDRILIIGWRANDKYLLEIIKEKVINKAISITIVNHTSSDEVKKKMQELSFLQVKSLNMGFTEFIKSGEYEKFFDN